jgi:hypothetical protein
MEAMEILDINPTSLDLMSIIMRNSLKISKNKNSPPFP